MPKQFETKIFATKIYVSDFCITKIFLEIA